MAKRVGGLGIKFGAAALIGIGFFVKKAFTAIDATAKLADTLALTTEELVGYQHAAAIAGATTQDVTTAFRRMLKNVSDAGLGLTTAQRAFEAMGLDADKLKGLKTDEIFKKIADQINKIPTAADRARVAQDLFGRSGLKILKITEGGAEGIRKLQAEALKLGIAYSRIDAAKIEAANDAIQRAKSVLQGVINTLAIKLAPLLEATANKFRDLSAETNAFGTIIGDTFKASVEWIKTGSTAITRFKQAFNFLGSMVSGVAFVITGVLNQIGLGFMILGKIVWNYGAAVIQTFKTIGATIKVAWKGMKFAFLDFIDFSAQKFASFISSIADGVAFLTPTLSAGLNAAAEQFSACTGSARYPRQSEPNLFSYGRSNSCWSRAVTCDCCPSLSACATPRASTSPNAYDARR